MVLGLASAGVAVALIPLTRVRALRAMSDWRQGRGDVMVLAERIDKGLALEKREKTGD
jgi:hypothetical protein